MREIWKRIEAWLDAHVPSGAGILRPGATEEQIAAAERFLGVSLPEDVRVSFGLHNGQSRGPWLMYGWELLSLERVREEWVAWKALLDEGTFRDFRSTSDGQTAEDWWHPRWLPLTYDGAGDHHCLDLHPGPTGQPGQIIQMWHDDSPRPVVAPSYRDWLAAFADALDAGKYVYSEQYIGLVPPEDAGQS
jgi:cell wall assembly regulator SMI1